MDERLGCRQLSWGDSPGAGERINNTPRSFSGGTRIPGSGTVSSRANLRPAPCALLDHERLHRD